MKSQQQIQFHVDSQDYFATLATVLDLIRQDIESGPHKKQDCQCLKKLRDDLMFLQENYRIVKRSEKGGN